MHKTFLRGAASVLAVILVAGGASAARRPAATHALACTDKTDAALPLTIPVNGEPATGRYAAPARPPKALVVFDHGYGHTSASWATHMKTAAAAHGLLAVTMDYRGIKISPDSNGDGLPESRGWNVMKGAQDSIAAAQLFERKCKSIEKIVVFGVSMGGNTSGLAVALSKDAKRSDGKPLFDYWFDIEGAVNVVETYAGARVLAPVNTTAANAKEDIEAETGGPIESNRDAYFERAVVNRMADIKASGIKGVVIVHGLDDGLVPYNQAREMAGLLARDQIPAHLYTIGRRDPQSERDTTASGYVAGAVKPDYVSPLSGHASEKSTTHIIMTTSFSLLWEVLGGAAPTAYAETFIDGELGSKP